MAIKRKPNSGRQTVTVQNSSPDFSLVKVLVVEDNKINQLLVKNMLTNFGFTTIDSVENGKAALEKLEKKKYDIILMDIQMPLMDGFEITQAIRTTMKHIPVIALSADASEEEKTKAVKAGMNDYLVKPYLPEELYSVMLKHLNNFEEISTAKPKKKSSFKTLKTSSVKTKGIDLNFLEKITGGDVRITIQLIELFISEVPEAILKLEKLIPEKNWKEVHAIAHKVKSGISVFELTELKKIILNIEDYSREKTNLEEVPKLFRKFKKGCNEAVLDLSAELIKLQQSLG